MQTHTSHIHHTHTHHTSHITHIHTPHTHTYIHTNRDTYTYKILNNDGTTAKNKKLFSFFLFFTFIDQTRKEVFRFCCKTITMATPHIVNLSLNRKFDTHTKKNKTKLNKRPKKNLFFFAFTFFLLLFTFWFLLEKNSDTFRK